MTSLARILLVGANPQTLEPIARRLEELGLPTITASAAAAAVAACEDLRPNAVLLDAGQTTQEDAVRLAAAVRHRIAIPIIALWPADAPRAPKHAFDAVLRHPVNAAQAAARVQSALRMDVMTSEAGLRKDTLGGMGIAVPDIVESDHAALNILFVGDADPAFMGLKSALDAASETINVVAAFTSFTAFDYLHNQNFHAIVLNALKENEPAFTICSALRRNSRLFHVPALILNDPARFADGEEAFARGASDLLNATAPETELAFRILALAQERARGLAVRQTFESIRDHRVLDRDTGLFNRDMSTAHLKAMGAQAGKAERPLSFIAVRAAPSALEKAPPPRERLVKARAEFGSMLRFLVRPEDFAARLDDGIFLIAMPGASEAEASEAAKRITMVSDCTAFAEDEQGEAIRLRMKCAVAGRQSGETGIQLLNRTIGGLERGATPPRREAPLPTGLS